MEGEEAISGSKIVNPEFVVMEKFHFFDPSFNVVGQGGHEEDHGGDLPVQAC